MKNLETAAIFLIAAATFVAVGIVFLMVMSHVLEFALNFM